MRDHVKKEILLRENSIRKKGTKFIFPLPKIQIIWDDLIFCKHQI